MALNASAKTFNIKSSLDKYCGDNLETTEGFAVDYEGLPFDETQVDEWVQPRIIDSDGVYTRQASSSRYGEETSILFQINIFVKKGSISNAARHYQMRDSVANYFKIRQDISIRDYDAGGTTTVDNFRVRNVNVDFPLPETQTLYQYAIAWDLVYTRVTDNPT